MEAIGAIVGVFAAVAFLWVGFHCVERVTSSKEASFKRRLMEENGADGLDFLGGELPFDIPHELLEVLPSSLLVMWCVSGWRGGERVVCFRYVPGYRRQWLWRHAVAVRREHPERASKPTRAMAVSADGHWALVTYGWGLNVKRLVELWDSLKTVHGAEGEALQRARRVPGEVVIRPRHEV